MKQLRIRELIDSFTANYVPGQVRSAFASWFLDRKDAAEKERAVEEIWDGMSLGKERYDASDMLPDAAEVLRDAKAVESPSESAQLRRWKRIAALLGAAACLGLVSSAALLLTGNSSTTTILSTTDSKAHFTLPDGSSVWLNRHSTLSYADNLKGGTRSLTLDGEAFFDVQKDPEHPFVVSTQNVAVKVLGTRFVLSAYGSRPESVYLESGKVSLISESFPQATLLPGEAFTFDPVSGTVCRRNEKAVNHLSWTGDRLEFANAELGDIMTSLEHWYNVKINVDRRVAAVRLTLTVRQEPLAEILDAIARISGCGYTVNGSEVSVGTDFR